MGSWKTSRWLHVAGVSILVFVAGGCDGCQKTKPYTPFTLTESPSATTSASSAHEMPAPLGDAGSQLDAGAASSFEIIKGAAPEGDGKSWPLAEGVTVAAPAGRTFGLGLMLEVDGDQKNDLIAWARSPDGLRGEIGFVSSKTPDAVRTIAALPGDLSVVGCTADAELQQVGPRTLVFDYRPRCGARAHDKAIRWIAILRLPVSDAPADASPQIDLEFRVAALPEGESIDVAVDPRDRDGDGRSDILTTLTFAGAPAPLPPGSAPLSVPLAFFDRPAGLSRDPTEPQGSLKALAASLVADARRKTSAGRIAADAPALRRLFAILCKEGGSPRFVTGAGPVSCGDLHLVEDTVMAEVEAAMNFDDPISALAAIARLDARSIRRKDIDAFLAKRIPQVDAVQIHKISATPLVFPPPAYGPLAFDRNGDILVRTSESAVRVDHASFEEHTIDRPLEWPKQLSGPADKAAWTLAGIERRCDLPTLVAQMKTASGTVVTPLPVATPLPCSPEPLVSSELLGASADGLLLAIGAEIVAFPAVDPPKPVLATSLGSASGAAIPLGAARSPDGSIIALDTTRGVFVASTKGAGRGAKGRLWTKLDVAGAHLCVPADDAARLACVSEGAAAIYEAK